MNEKLPHELERLILEQMGDALIYADRDGIIRGWNAAAQALFGYAKDEALGQSLDIIIPERLRAPHWDGFHRAMASGATRHGRRALLTRAVDRAGATLYVEMSFAVVVSAAQEVLGAVAVARDGTRRREDEHRLRELEAAHADAGNTP